MDIEAESSEGRSEGSDCGDIWIDGDLLFGAIGALGALAAYWLYVTVTMKGRRRKKRNAIASEFISSTNWLLLGNLSDDFTHSLGGEISHF